MSWKKLRGIPLSYEEQVLIRATCLLYRQQPKSTQKKIDHLCRECGGEYCAALFDVMTTSVSITALALRHHVSESQLYNLRHDFYMAW